MGDIDEQHAGDPRPVRGVRFFAVEPAKVPADRKRDERQHSGTAERGDIDDR